MSDKVDSWSVPYLFIHSFIHSSIHPFIHSCIHLSIHASIRAIVLFFVHLFKARFMKALLFNASKYRVKFPSTFHASGELTNMMPSRCFQRIRFHFSKMERPSRCKYILPGLERIWERTWLNMAEMDGGGDPRLISPACIGRFASLDEHSLNKLHKDFSMVDYEGFFKMLKRRQS